MGLTQELRRGLPDGSSNVLGQLFQSNHTSKLQDQFRQGLQLKVISGGGTGMGLTCGAGSGTEDGPDCRPWWMLGSHLRGCLHCNTISLDPQVAEYAVHTYGVPG